MCNMCSDVYSSRKRLSPDSPTPSATFLGLNQASAPRGSARTSTSTPTPATDKVGTFGLSLAQQMAVNGVPKCLLSEPGRDVEGQAEGSALIFLPSSCAEDSGRSGAAVFPAQQVRTLIGSDTDVQNCQGTSASPLSGVVPANTPPSPLTSQAPSVPVCSTHMHAHTRTHTHRLKSWPKG